MWLKHSKGPWKEHKYVRKEGKGESAKYYYAAKLDTAGERLAKGFKDIAENQFNPVKNTKSWQKTAREINNESEKANANRRRRLYEYNTKDTHSILEKIQFGLDYVTFYVNRPVTEIVSLEPKEELIHPETFLGLGPNLKRLKLPGEK